MFFKIIRAILGPIIIFLAFITRPKKIKRSEEAQRAADQMAEKLTLYQFRTCPFCVKVRNEIYRLNIKVKLCDAKNDARCRSELLENTGKIKVPCLRIEENGAVRWMPESNNIKEYLNQRFANIGI